MALGVLAKTTDPAISRVFHDLDDRGNVLAHYTTSPLKGEASQWWALSDLNGRPFGCKPNALTAELSALTSHILHQFNTLRQISDRARDRKSWNNWTSWNNFVLVLHFRQLKSDANSLRYLSTERPVLVHFHVLVGYGVLDNFAVPRLRVPGPVADQSARHVIGFQVRDAEAPETVEALLLNSKLFQRRMQVSSEE